MSKCYFLVFRFLHQYGSCQKSGPLTHHTITYLIKYVTLPLPAGNNEPYQRSSISSVTNFFYLFEFNILIQQPVIMPWLIIFYFSNTFYHYYNITLSSCCRQVTWKIIPFFLFWVNRFVSHVVFYTFIMIIDTLIKYLIHS